VLLLSLTQRFPPYTYDMLLCMLDEQQAKNAFSSRTFDGKQVEAVFIPQADFDARKFG
jgi:hypothetical protein